MRSLTLVKIIRQAPWLSLCHILLQVLPEAQLQCGLRCSVDRDTTVDETVVVWDIGAKACLLQKLLTCWVPSRLNYITPGFR